MGNFRHYKDSDGKKYPRCTSVISQIDKPALMIWSVNCACDYILQGMSLPQTIPIESYMPVLIEEARKEWRSVQKEALDIGSQTHGYIEEYLKTGKEPDTDKIPEQVLSAFVAFLEWKDEHKLEVIKTEHTVFGKDWAGTLDLFCKLDGKKYTVDFKTSRKPYNDKPYPEWAWQLAAYRSCVDGCEGMGVLRLDKKNGLPDWYDLTDKYEQALKTFNILVELWYSRHLTFKP